jgi:hypothetical protein
MNNNIDFRNGAMRNTSFWDITPCTDIFLGLFGPEDGGDTFLLNVG